MLSANANRIETFAGSFAAATDYIFPARGCLFTFHRAAPSLKWETLPNRGFYLDLNFLDRLLSYLTARGWEVVTLDEVLRRCQHGPPRGRFVNFSVDDCYRDTFEEVVPLFRQHNLPVTLFVTTGIPDGTLLLCEAGLEDVIVSRDQIFVEEERIVTASPDQKQAAFDKITAAWGPNAFEQYADFCARNGVDSDVMNARHAISWDMLEQLRDDPLVEIGAHTISHPRVSSLSQSEAFTELKKSRDRLIEKLNVPVRHFAFPFGRTKDCGPRDFALAKAASFASAATTRKGLIVHKQDFFQLPRNTINGRHRNLAMMEMHLSGLTGLATRVTRLG